MRAPNETATTVLITGASSGLGYELAMHYAREGATVHALARRARALEDLAEASRRSGVPGCVVPAVVDVTDAEALAAAIEVAYRAAGGALDLGIANAGVYAAGPVARMDWRTVKHVLDVNTTAACVTIAAALPAMVARGSGTLVAISPLAGFRGHPGRAAYSASKAALRYFMEGVRAEVAGTGFRVITVFPGIVKTEMAAGFEGADMMASATAARLIAKGIARGEAEIAFPLPLATRARFTGALPRWIYEPLVRLRRGLRR